MTWQESCCFLCGVGNMQSSRGKEARGQTIMPVLPSRSQFIASSCCHIISKHTECRDMQDQHYDKYKQEPCTFIIKNLFPVHHREAKTGRVCRMGDLRQSLCLHSPLFYQSHLTGSLKALADLPFLLQYFIEAFLLLLQQPLEMLHFSLILSSLAREFLLLFGRFEAQVSQLPGSILFINL